MVGSRKTPKNYQKILTSLDYDFPGLLKIPRAPGTFLYRDLVDINVAKKKLELVNRLPKFDPGSIGLNKFNLEDFKIDNVFLASLMAAGYSSVFEELMTLLKEEKELIGNCTPEGYRKESFTQDKTRMSDLIKGLIACAKAEASEGTKQKVRIRKALGEQMVTLADFWLARKMFTKCFSYLDQIDEETDKVRVELWALISYICIYFEDSQEIGYDLPAKYLSMARNLCRDKPWFMHQTVMSIFIPKSTNVYGLKNDWLKIKANWVDMYCVVTTLLHVLAVKKAKYWQEQLGRCNREEDPSTFEKLSTNVADELTSALAYADEVRQYPAFMAVTIRRGLFYDEIGNHEKALEDYSALHTLSKRFDDKEVLAIAVNRYAYHHRRHGNAVGAMDHLVHQFEICKEHDFPEIKADAMHDVGSILLTEGHTWEAEECYTKAYTTFRDTKTTDTPNNLDDLSWGMLGVSRGMHLWGRYASHLRIEDSESTRAVMNWKSLRKPLPPFVLTRKYRKPHKTAEYESQYDLHPSRKKKEESTRRLFEFHHDELKSRHTIWFAKKGYDNVFDYINKSDKARDFPEFKEDFGHGTTSSWQNRRVKQKKSLAQWDKYRGLTMTPGSWEEDNFPQVYPKKKGKSMKFAEAKNRNLTVEARMAALLDDLEDVAKLRTSLPDPFGDDEEETDMSAIIPRMSHIDQRLFKRFKSIVAEAGDGEEQNLASVLSSDGPKVSLNLSLAEEGEAT